MELSNVTLEIFTKLEQKWLSHYETSKKIRILSIDGGGIGTTGIAAGAALVHLEDQIRIKTSDAHAKIVDFFDVIAGTGIGAVLAAMISAEDGTGHPLFTAREAVDIITQKKIELFKVNKLAGFLFPRKMFNGKSMDKALKDLFKRDDGTVLTMKDTCKPLLVPCYDLKSSAPFVFSHADASASPSFNFEIWKVCRATSATPGFFRPFPLTSVDGKTSCSAVDGGLVMNNPTAVAVTHVLHNKRDFPSINSVEDLLVLSLGNGPSCGTSKVSNKCSTSSVVDIALDGVSETVDQMMANAFSWNRTNYVRIQPNEVGRQKMEVLKERGIESLPFGGKRLLTETNGQRIEAFVHRLVATGKTAFPSSPCKEPAVRPLANGQ